MVVTGDNVFKPLPDKPASNRKRALKNGHIKRDFYRFISAYFFHANACADAGSHAVDRQTCGKNKNGDKRHIDKVSGAMLKNCAIGRTMH